MTSPPFKAFSFGGGVQSTAALVLAATGRLPEYKDFLFCNVGEDSENPLTIEYVESHSKPFAAKHGLNLVELRATRYGETETVMGRIQRNPTNPMIPLWGSNGKPLMRRACTRDFKITLINRWHKENGATIENPSIAGIGFSIDEMHRIGKKATTEDEEAGGEQVAFDFLEGVEKGPVDERNSSQVGGLRRGDAASRILVHKREYPLIKLRISRTDCKRIIADAGLPEPPRSSCWFCPFHNAASWLQLQDEQPELATAAVNLERQINDALAEKGKQPVRFYRKLPTLQNLFDQDRQATLSLDEDDDGCSSGYCVPTI